MKYTISALLYIGLTLVFLLPQGVSASTTDETTEIASVGKDDTYVGKRKRNAGSKASKRSLKRQPKGVQKSIKRNKKRNRKEVRERKRKQHRQKRYSRIKTFR